MVNNIFEEEIVLFLRQIQMSSFIILPIFLRKIITPYKYFKNNKK